MELWPSPMVWGYYPELIGWAFQLREIKSTGMHQAPTRGPIFNSVILEVPGEDGIDSVPRSRQCHQGEEAYHTRSKQNLAPDPSHCNFRVHQVTLSSRGHPWQRPVGSIVSTAAHISGPCWPIWQDAFYIKSLVESSCPAWVRVLTVLARFALHQTSVSLGLRHWYWFSKICFILQFNWWNNYIHQLFLQVMCNSRWRIWRADIQNAPCYPDESSQMSTHRNKQKHNSHYRADYLPRDSEFRIMQNRRRPV